MGAPVEDLEDYTQFWYLKHIPVSKFLPDCRPTSNAFLSCILVSIYPEPHGEQQDCTWKLYNHLCSVDEMIFQKGVMEVDG
ncbi:Hypothetical predicted protein [Pelobates cultripes]|uniref:Uncharacterized protein n=1 Tax=Pelobates cultripes TaxID=61616 RepID=A0AAD1TH99_PELCU|nr:Hypothetical predicted protein [Pelobates cultripes]